MRKFKIKNKWSGKVVVHDEVFLQMLVDRLGNKVAAQLLAMESVPGKELMNNTISIVTEV